MFYQRFVNALKEIVSPRWDVVHRTHNPRLGHRVDTNGISSRTALILWGDEMSQQFPQEYFDAAGAIIKPYCPESWEARGVIPVTDVAMCTDAGRDDTDILPVSRRPYTVMFSGNLNYRRTDLYRACSRRSFGYPFRISSNLSHHRRIPTVA